METAFEMVRMAAERTPDHIAIVDDRTEKSHTYKEFILQIETMAAGLVARGIGRGDRFATILPNLFEHCIILLALSRLGAVPALINGRLNPADIATLIVDCDAKGAILPADEKLAAIVRKALPARAPVLTVAGAQNNNIPGTEDCAGCVGQVSDLPPLFKAGEEDLAYIFYTSGTTGLPKGVLIPEKNTLSRTIWLSTQAGITYGTHNRVLGLTPLSHCIGYWGNFLIALAMNGTYYVMTKFDPEKAVDMVEQHGITMVFTVPTIFFAMTKAPGYAPEKMASLQHVLYGGGAILPRTLDQIDAEWGGRVVHIYGTTETMNSLYHPEPVGRPTRLRPGFYANVRLVRFGSGPEDIVDVGEEGELIVDASPSTIFTGYLNRPDVTAEKLRDGWYFTGDVCVRRAGDEMDIVGRVDDVIRTGGENVHPEEVEAILQKHADVSEVSVVAAPDDYWGQIVVACIVGVADKDDLDSLCRASRLANYKRPRRYLFLDSLPKNAANKVLRRTLREIAVKEEIKQIG